MRRRGKEWRCAVDSRTSWKSAFVIPQGAGTRVMDSASIRYIPTTAGRAALALFRRIGAERARRRVILFARVAGSIQDGATGCILAGGLVAAAMAGALVSVRWGFAPLLRDEPDFTAAILRFSALAGAFTCFYFVFENAFFADLLDALEALARRILLGRDPKGEDHAEEAGGRGEEHGDEEAPEGEEPAAAVVAPGDGDAVDGEPERPKGAVRGELVDDEKPARGEFAGEAGGLAGDGEGIRFLRGLSEDGAVGAIWLFCIHAPIVAEADMGRKDGGENAEKQDGKGMEVCRG